MRLGIEKLKNFEQRTLFCVSRHKMSLQVIEPPSKEVMEKVRGEFGLNERRVREAVDHLKDWLRLQPHLPKEIGKFVTDTVNSTTLFITVDMLEVEAFALLRCYAAYVGIVYRRFGAAVDHTEHGAKNKTIEWKGICVLCWTLHM
jgi:hypothetical protein